MPIQNVKSFRSPVPETTEQADSPNATHGRRRFLRTSANAGLLGAALGLFSRTLPIQAAEQAGTGDTNQPSPSGYHETDHIRKYYAKARQF
jgi:hypothetical protein